MSSQQFYDLLTKIGYPGLKDLTPDSFEWVVDSNPEFFDWFCNTIREENILTPQEAELYKAAVESGTISEKEIRNANMNLESSRVEDIATTSQPVKDSLTEKICEIKRKQVQKDNEALNYVLNNLSNSREKPQFEDDTEVSEILNISSSYAAEKVFEDTLKKRNDALKDDTTAKKMDKVITELGETVKMLEEGLKSCEAEGSSHRFAHLAINDIISKEKQYNEILKEFLEKQFPKTLPPESLDDNSPVPDRSPEQEELRKETEKLYVYLIKSHEAWLTESLLEARESAAKETLNRIQKSLEDGTFPSESTIRAKMPVIRNELTEVNEKIILMKEKAKSLIAQLAEATAGAVFTDNYTLKRTRQSYFLSKLDKVIEQLIQQKVNGMMVSWLTDYEHGLLSAINSTLEEVYKTLEEQVESSCKRMAAMEKLKSDNEKSKTHVDDEIQKFLKTLSEERTEEVATGKKITGRFGFDVIRFVKESETKDAEQQKNFLSSVINKHEHLQDVSKNLNQLQETIWSDCTSLSVEPFISPKPMVDGMNEIEQQLDCEDRLKHEVVKNYEEKSRVQ